MVTATNRTAAREKIFFIVKTLIRVGHNFNTCKQAVKHKLIYNKSVNVINTHSPNEVLAKPLAKNKQ